MRIIKRIVAILIVAIMFSCGNQKADVKSLKNEVDSVSYALGLDMAFKIKSNWDKADVDLYQQGFRNGMDSINLLLEMNPAKINAVLNPFFKKLKEEKRTELQEKTNKEAEAKFGEVKKNSEDFLASNKTKEGVLTTASGLQYMVIKEGKGRKVFPNDNIKIHYHGTTIDGKVFDSSVDKKTPIESNASQFIKGFNEGLSLMNQGAKYTFFIPQELGYGAQKRGELIQPFSALIFEVEVLEIKK